MVFQDIGTCRVYGVAHMILDALVKYMDQTVSYYAASTGLDAYGVPNEGWGGTAYKTVKAGFYTGSTAQAYVSDRYRPVTDGVIICKPTDKPATTDKVTFSGRSFAVNGIDNIAERGAVCVVSVQEIV